jgi:hypothetical protein
VVEPILRCLDDRRSILPEDESYDSNNGAWFPVIKRHPQHNYLLWYTEMRLQRMSFSSAVYPIDAEGNVLAANPPATIVLNLIAVCITPIFVATAHVKKHVKPKETLLFMESLRPQIGMLAIVLAAVCIALWTYIMDVRGRWLKIYDNSIMSFFLADISIRYYCWMSWHLFARTAWWQFWDVFRTVDGGCVAIDVITLIASKVPKKHPPPPNTHKHTEREREREN